MRILAETMGMVRLLLRLQLLQRELLPVVAPLVVAVVVLVAEAGWVRCLVQASELGWVTSQGITTISLRVREIDRV